MCSDFEIYPGRQRKQSNIIVTVELALEFIQ